MEIRTFIFVVFVIGSLFGVSVFFVDVEAQSVPDWIKNISKWFGYPIYISQIQNYEEINKEILPILKYRM